MLTRSELTAPSSFSLPSSPSSARPAHPLSSVAGEEGGPPTSLKHTRKEDRPPTDPYGLRARRNATTQPHPPLRLPPPFTGLRLGLSIPMLTYHRGVPYNPLLDQGYKSIGDVHSTALPDPNAATDAGERSGRWQGKAKSECGLHTNYFEMKKKFEQKAEPAAA